MKKIRTTINLENFIDLWNNIERRSWDRVMPDFWDQIKGVWQDEIKKRFLQMKKGGSYGRINDFIFSTLLKNTENTYLPRSMGYKPSYAQKYPFTYVKTGYLKSEMENDTTYENIITDNRIGVRVNIPMKPDPEEKEGYMELEETRSFIKSSFVLAWPKIIQKTLESIGK